jgi:hypothetical protein
MSQNTKPQETLLYPKEAAKFLRVDENTLAKWRQKGNGPAYVKISSRAIRYELSELERFKEELKRRSTWEDLDHTLEQAATDDPGKKKMLRKVVKEALLEILTVNDNQEEDEGGTPSDAPEPPQDP